MKKATIVLLAIIAWTTAGARTARAQGDELIEAGYINVDAGAQPQRRTITASDSFPLYDEQVTVTASQRIRNGGVFEVGAGARMATNLAVGVGFSLFGRPGTGSVTASVPHPAFFDRRVTVTQDVADLAHTERSIHLKVTWFRPVTDTVDVSVSAGPSFVHVIQDVATSVTVQAGTQNITVVKQSQTGNAIGINAGFDVNYMPTRRFGVGLFVKYLTGSLDLPTAPGFKVGGLQAGLGVRGRF